MDIIHIAAELLIAIKSEKPLIHQITNYVSMNDCANITLAIGASPVMANDPQEVEEMVSHAAALVINIGTLDANKIQSMLSAGKRANELGIPVIFDPVGVGATSLRTQAAAQIMQSVRLSVIRGNMSEIKQLAGLSAVSRGVDSIADSAGGTAAAQQLAKQLECVVVITGKADLIAGRNAVVTVENGHALLTGVTGTGCMATALIGCFCGVTKDFLPAAVSGILAMGIAGEIAAGSLRSDEGLGTFRTRLFDAMSSMTPQLLIQYAKISEITSGEENKG